jgi:hypothetical protein
MWGHPGLLNTYDGRELRLEQHPRLALVHPDRARGGHTSEELTLERGNLLIVKEEVIEPGA